MIYRIIPSSLFVLAFSLGVVNIVSGVVFPAFYELVMAGELGIIENAQALFLAIALVMALVMAGRTRHRGQ